MTNQKAYKLIEKDAGKAQLLDSDSHIISTHLGNEFLALSVDIAKLLQADLNAIYSRNSALNRPHNVELKESLIYCVISTFMEAPGDHVHDINLDALQWDRVFRLSPGPPNILVEMNAIEPLKAELKADWANLPLNYARSIEEMKEDEYADFVPEEIINEMKELLNGLKRHQRFEMLLLGHLYNNFSLVAALFFVANKISSEEYFSLFVAFEHAASLAEIKELEGEYAANQLDRLEHLRRFNNSIGKRDIKEIIE